MQTLFSVSAPGISISATDSASAAVALPAGSANSIRVTNESLTDAAFVAVGTSTVTATLPAAGVGTRTCMCVLPGDDIIMRIDPVKENFISAICRATKTATLSVYESEGGK